jgi:hypothetical protein
MSPKRPFLPEARKGLGSRSGARWAKTKPQNLQRMVLPTRPRSAVSGSRREWGPSRSRSARAPGASGGEWPRQSLLLPEPQQAWGRRVLGFDPGF